MAKISRNQRRKLAKLKAIDNHNTALVLARKAERQAIVARNLAAPKEKRTLYGSPKGLRAAGVYEFGMHKS